MQRAVLAWTVDVAPLSTCFLAALPAEERSGLVSLSDLEDRLGGWVALAQAAWPTVHYGAEDFIRHVARKFPSLAAVRTVTGVAVSDLFLAGACGAGIDEAIESFRSSYAEDIRAAAASVRGSSDRVDDLYQELEVRLFVEDVSGHPLILDFAGRSSLRSWVRSVVVHAALKTLRRSRREVALDRDVAERVRAAEVEPWVIRAKEAYSHAFEHAFHRAMAELTPRERNLLRQTTLDRLTVEELGALYGVHRATAARWVVAVRERVLEKTRAAMVAEMKVERRELDSMLRAVRSQLHVTLRRCLL